MRVIAVQIRSLWGAQPSLVLSPAGWQSLCLCFCSVVWAHISTRYCYSNGRLVWLSGVDATSSISCSIFSWSVGEDLCPSCGWVAFVQLCLILIEIRLLWEQCFTCEHRRNNASYTYIVNVYILTMSRSFWCKANWYKIYCDWSMTCQLNIAKGNIVTCSTNYLLAYNRSGM